ncbi:hypothetical protein [Subtercola endophyticus]|uniref:hypothetical protein n=1 Tax=Subtercola endophyticus TaxID=2895559 RepID=UPI001E652BAE|nr:hypothetical protein [Subtercola endophyticus]UFS58586.1 hypothetical protein LQ955_16530 [Subtercola endophyticus]
MNTSSNRLRRLAASALVALSLAGGLAMAGSTAANAQGAIPCMRDGNGVCHGYGSSGGGASSDPWVANLFYDVYGSYNNVYARKNGSDVDQTYANYLASNLHFKSCNVKPGFSKLAFCN